MRAALLAAIAVLYLFSIPWYRDSGEAPDRILGLPDWVVVAIGCYVAAAVLNALAWLATDVRDDDPGPPDDG